MGERNEVGTTGERTTFYVCGNALPFPILLSGKPYSTLLECITFQLKADCIYRGAFSAAFAIQPHRAPRRSAHCTHLIATH